MTGTDTNTPGRPRRARLSDMVSAAQWAGMSYAKMAEASGGPAGEPGMSKAWFHRLATDQVATAPKPEELEAVARALGKPLRLVQEAAASQWLAWESLELSGYDDDMRHIIVVAASMSPRERRRLRVMLEAGDQADREDLSAG